MLLYGCNVAADSDGQSLLDNIARLTGADVVASDDLTGSAELGGDWQLEYQAGDIQSSVAFNPQTKQSWIGLLADNLPPVNTEPSSSSELGAIQAKFGELPLYFIENQGQVDDRVEFYIQTTKGIAYFTPTGVTFVLNETPAPETDHGTPEVGAATGIPEPTAADQRWTVKLDFVGANPSAQPVGRDLTSAVVSYFTGSGEEQKTGLPTYASVVYENLWEGIDLVYTGEAGRLKATYIVKPGADPGQIQLAYLGPDDVVITESGSLLVSTPLGGFEEAKPYSYQETGGTQVEVATPYALQAASDAGAFPMASRWRTTTGHRRSSSIPSLGYCGFIGKLRK